jgi:hypothetical protein
MARSQGGENLPLGSAAVPNQTDAMAEFALHLVVDDIDTQLASMFAGT